MTLPLDQPVRARVLQDFDTTLLLEAGAGTGKTTAAGELKLRLREEIEAASDEERERLEAAAFDLERAPVEPRLLVDALGACVSLPQATA